jgi:hypothetical protein
MRCVVMSVDGTSRHFGTARQLVTFGGKADIRRPHEPQSVFGPIRRLRIEHALVAEFERRRPGFAERHRAIKA